MMTVVGMAATPQEALAILREQPVDLALVDLVLGNHRSGVEAGRAMRRIRPELKVIIYTKQKGMVLAAEILWERKTGEQPKLQGYVLRLAFSSWQEMMLQGLRKIFSLEA